MSKIKDKLKGKFDFTELKKVKENNKSPTPNAKLTKDDILRKIEFCKYELKVHKENLNNVMIGFKTAEIKDLEKQL